MKSSYMDFKLIYEIHTLILFSIQRWCRIDAEAPNLFNRRDHSAACQRAAMLGYVNEKAWVKPVQANFFVSLLIFWLNWNQREDLIEK